MPLILATSDQVDRRLDADTVEALALQRPVADDALRIVARGETADALEICADVHADATKGTGRKLSSSPGLIIALAGNRKCSGLLKSSTVF